MGVVIKGHVVKHTTPVCCAMHPQYQRLFRLCFLGEELKVLISYVCSNIMGSFRAFTYPFHWEHISYTKHESVCVKKSRLVICMNFLEDE